MVTYCHHLQHQSKWNSSLVAVGKMKKKETRQEKPQLFTELEELCVHWDGNLEWKETARWWAYIKQRKGDRYRSSHQRCSVKTDVPKTCNFIKKRLRHRCFPVKFDFYFYLTKFLRTSNLKNIYERLLLSLPNVAFNPWSAKVVLI